MSSLQHLFFLFILFSFHFKIMHNIEKILDTNMFGK
jgi:hypothetical protein